MYFSDYIDQTRQNVLDAFANNPELADRDESDILDILIDDDSVTGNGSGSYTCDAQEARENIIGCMFESDPMSRLEDSGFTLTSIANNGPEGLDVLFRCKALETLDMEELVEEFKSQNS